jgi:hypothetical protein
MWGKLLTGRISNGLEPTWSTMSSQLPRKALGYLGMGEVQTQRRDE